MLSGGIDQVRQYPAVEQRSIIVTNCRGGLCGETIVEVGRSRSYIDHYHPRKERSDKKYWHCIRCHSCRFCHCLCRGGSGRARCRPIVPGQKNFSTKHPKPGGLITQGRPVPGTTHYFVKCHASCSDAFSSGITVIFLSSL